MAFYPCDNKYYVPEGCLTVATGPYDGNVSTISSATFTLPVTKKIYIYPSITTVSGYGQTGRAIRFSTSGGATDLKMEVCPNPTYPCYETLYSVYVQANVSVTATITLDNAVSHYYYYGIPIAMVY